MKNIPHMAAFVSTIAAFTVVAVITFSGSGYNRVVAPIVMTTVR